MQDIKELNLEIERTKRIYDNLKKNYERRKKLNLVDDEYESQVKPELRKYENDIASLERQLRSIESQNYRKKIIDDSRK